MQLVTVSPDGSQAVVLDDFGTQKTVALNHVSPELRQQILAYPPAPQQGPMPTGAPIPAPPTPPAAPAPMTDDVPGWGFGIPKMFRDFDQKAAADATAWRQAQGQASPPSTANATAAPAQSATSVRDTASLINFTKGTATPAGAEVLGPQALYSRGAQEQVAAQGQKADAEAPLLQEMSDTYGQVSKRIGELGNEGQAHLLGNQKATDAAMDQYRNLSDQIGSFKIDPNRLWHTATTGQKVVAGIGMALGAIGGALTHSGNAGLELIENAINRDVDAQKVELEGKQRELAAQGTLVGMYQQRGLSIQQATEAAKATYIDAVKAHVEQVTFGIQRADLLVSKQDLMGRLDQLKAQFAQAAGFQDFQEGMMGARLQMNPAFVGPQRVKAIFQDVGKKYFGAWNDKTGRYEGALVGPGSSVSQWLPATKTKQYLDDVSQRALTLAPLLHMKPTPGNAQWIVDHYFPSPADSADRAQAKFTNGMNAAADAASIVPGAAMDPTEDGD